MKILLTIAGLLNGSYMLIDGVYVILKGKYMGPAKPGPWAELFYKLNVDVFKLGWLFIAFGILWLIELYALWTNKDWAFAYSITISILTLWYVPAGTFLSLLTIALLLLYRHKIG
jgi:uncharacterized membrane protein (DUF2068 family)